MINCWAGWSRRSTVGRGGLGDKAVGRGGLGDKAVGRGGLGDKLLGGVV